MKTRLLAFIDALRGAGVSVTVAETLDAMRAVTAIGLEPPRFREALATTLVKEEADRPIFNAVFDSVFGAPGRRRGKGERTSPTDEGEGRSSGKPGTLPGRSEQPERRGAPTPRRESEHHQSEMKQHRAQEPAGRRLAQQRTLKTLAFSEMSAQQIEECEVLVKELAQRFRAHLARRQRSARRGRLNVRRTIRRSISKGGVPMEPAFRRRQPGRPDLIVLCDYSYSVATASNFLLALLAPAHEFFRRVRLFAFVDQPVEVSIEDGKLVPHGDLDLYARSDLGKVLASFSVRHEGLLTHNTVLLILGDARNNRRPPRADLLARLRNKCETWSG